MIKARFIIELLFDFMQQNEIDYENVTKNFDGFDRKFYQKLKDIVNDKDQMFKDSFDFIFNSFIKEVNKHGEKKQEWVTEGDDISVDRIDALLYRNKKSRTIS